MISSLLHLQEEKSTINHLPKMILQHTHLMMKKKDLHTSLHSKLKKTLTHQTKTLSSYF